MSVLQNISANLQQCKIKEVTELVQQAIDEGISANEILQDGLLDGMGVVGERFKNGDMFVPEVLAAAKAMSDGVLLLKPLLSDGTQSASGTVVIGTVKGDLHNVGKDLVKLLMESKGLNVVDLGVDVSNDKFLDAVRNGQCDILAMSAMLTSTMPIMGEVVKALEEENLRDQVKVMIGGAPVNPEFAKQIGADAYTNDATEAAEVAVGYVS